MAETTAESMLGIPGISQVARSAAGPGAITSQARAFLDDRLLNETAAILEKGDRIRALLQARKARASGQAVMGALSRLSPDAPDYLDKRNAILSQAPDAALDDTARNFLGLQEDVFRVAENKRQYQQGRQDRETDFGRQLDVQMDREQRSYDTQIRKEVERAARSLSPEAKAIYDMEFKGMAGKPNAEEEALSKARAFEDNQDARAQFLQLGVPKERLDALSKNGFLDKEAIYEDLGKIAEARREAVITKEQIYQLVNEIKMLESVADITNTAVPPEDKLAAKDKLPELRKKLSFLRGVEKEQANPSNPGAGGGAPDPHGF